MGSRLDEGRGFNPPSADPKSGRDSQGGRLLRCERNAVGVLEHRQQRERDAESQNQADEKQDGAKNLVPLQVHEEVDAEGELHAQHDEKRADDHALGERQIDGEDLKTGDDGEDHRHLHEQVELAFLGRALIGRRDGRGSAHGGNQRNSNR